MASTQPRPALGALPGAVNAQVSQIPTTGNAAAPGQENTPISLAGAKPASKKRKSTEAHNPIEQLDLESIELDRDYVDENCDQVRRKINRLLDSRGMTKTAFCKAIGVSAKSLNGFLGVHGSMNGSGHAAYGAAWKFFKKLEVAGLEIPAKKQKTSGAGTGSSGSKAAAATKTPSAPGVDLSDIALSGEDDDDVPVFDTCDEVRRKINAYLKKPGVTQAQFCRDLYAQLRGPDRPAKPFQGAQLSHFRNSKGPLSGVKSALFYAAYVFFEKMRIKEGKPKSKHRQEMEAQWGRSGINREHDGRTSFICRAGTHPYIDKYGKISVF